MKEGAGRGGADTLRRLQWKGRAPRLPKKGDSSQHTRCECRLEMQSRGAANAAAYHVSRSCGSCGRSCSAAAEEAAEFALLSKQPKPFTSCRSGWFTGACGKQA